MVGRRNSAVEEQNQDRHQDQGSARTTIVKGQTAAHFCPAELLSTLTVRTVSGTVCVSGFCVCVPGVCVRPCLYISLYVCDNVLFKCNNFNCNLPCVTPRHLTPSSPPRGQPCLPVSCVASCVCDDQLTASLHLFMSD